VVSLKQIHSGNIYSVEEAAVVIKEGDGLLLKEEGKAAGIKTADCAPVVIMTDEKAIALHVSRKSIVNGLMDNVLSFVSPTEITHVYIGPHICEYHFDFKDEDYMVRRFRSRFPRAAHLHRGVMYLSLEKAIRYFLDEWQVHAQRIESDGRCTVEMLGLPSYKRWLSEGKEGEMGIMMTVVEKIEGNNRS